MLFEAFIGAVTLADVADLVRDGTDKGVEEERERLYGRWKQAVKRSMGQQRFTKSHRTTGWW